MSRLRTLKRRIPMFQDAHGAMCAHMTTIKYRGRITVSVVVIRPPKAVVAFIVCVTLHPLAKRPLWGLLAKWLQVFMTNRLASGVMLLPVSSTQAPTSRGLVANCTN